MPLSRVRCRRKRKKRWWRLWVTEATSVYSDVCRLPQFQTWDMRTRVMQRAMDGPTDDGGRLGSFGSSLGKRESRRMSDDVSSIQRLAVFFWQANAISGRGINVRNGRSGVGMGNGPGGRGGGGVGESAAVVAASDGCRIGKMMDVNLIREVFREQELLLCSGP